MSRRRARQQAGALVSEYGLVAALIVLIVVFSALNPRFLTLPNFGTLLRQNAAVLIISVGMTFAILSRNIDLAPASIIALAGVALGLTYQATGSLALALAACFGVAILVDLFNALLIVRIGINPLIVTLACWIWARGLAVSLTGANSIVVSDPALAWLTNTFAFEISPAVVIALAAFAIGGWVLNRTRLGRYAAAMGSDERATVQAGVPVGKYKFLMFGMFGGLAGLAAVMTVSRLGAAAPAAAYGLELDAIVAVIIGGNPFQGGEAKLRRTLVGALFIAVLNNGLGNLGMLDAQIAVYKGAAILLALLFGAVSSRLAGGGRS